MRNRFTCCCDTPTLDIIGYLDEMSTTPFGNADVESLASPIQLVVPTSPSTTSISRRTTHQFYTIAPGFPPIYQSIGFAITFVNVPKATYASATITLPFSWEQYSDFFVSYPKPVHGYTIRVHSASFTPSAGLITINPNVLADYSSPGEFLAIPGTIPRSDLPGTENDRMPVTTPNIASLINPVLPVDTTRAIVVLFQPTGERKLGTQPGPAEFLEGSKYRVGEHSGFQPKLTLA